MSKDMFGREYLKFSEAKAGMKIELDDGFDCAHPGVTILSSDNKGLHFYCMDGNHYIDGQCDEGCDHCIGIYKVD